MSLRRTGPLKIEQVRKGGLPPLFLIFALGFGAVQAENL
jgi:hypothetical protein